MGECGEEGDGEVRCQEEIVHKAGQFEREPAFSDSDCLFFWCGVCELED